MVRKIAALLLFVPMSLLLVGCEPNIRHPVLIGDSLTQNAMVPTYRELALVAKGDTKGRYLPTFDAVAGVGVRVFPNMSATDVVQYWDVHLKSVVDHVAAEYYVIELGTNDCRYGGADNYGAAVDFVMSRLPASKPVLWVPLTMVAPDLQVCVQTVNAQLQLAVTRWPNLTVRALVEPPANFGSDGIHYNDEGNAAYARYLHGWLDDVRGQ